MKNAYLAICYSCNERCSYCPCSKQEKQDKLITPLSDIRTAIDQFVTEGITDITISGGEPTITPYEHHKIAINRRLCYKKEYQTPRSKCGRMVLF